MKKSVLFKACICLLMVSGLCSGNIVINWGFENDENTYGGVPTSFGHWKGDYSDIVGASGVITPFEGSKMLRFEGTGFNGAGSTTACEVIELVDLSDHLSLINSGQAVIRYSAYFNRVEGNENTDTSAAISIKALQGPANSFPDRFSSRDYIDESNNGLSIDSDAGSWQQSEVKDFALPTNTSYIAVVLIVAENVSNNTELPEFDGHFADNVSVEIIPEPMTLGLLGLGFLMVRKRCS